MNRKLLTKLTPDILAGAQSLGIDSRAQFELLGVTRSQYTKLTSGAKGLTARQVRELEEQIGRSVGELAVLGMAYHASPQKRAQHAKLIEDTCALMAQFDELDREAPLRRRAPISKLQAGRRSRSVA